MPTTVEFAIEGVEAYGVCGATYIEPGPQPGKPGDVNLDGEVNIADVNCVINAICNEGIGSPRLDSNHDGEINIADINAILDYILRGKDQSLQ